MNWTLCDNENNKRNHMYLKSNARSGRKMDIWRELKLQDREQNSPERSRYLHKTVMLSPKKGHLGAQFMTFHSTMVMLQVAGSFPAPSRCIKCVKSMNIFACILHTWNWAAASKPDTNLTSWSMGQSSGSHRSTWRVGKTLSCGCAAGTGENRCPTLKVCSGSSQPTLLGKGEVSVDMRQSPLSPICVTADLLSWAVLPCVAHLGIWAGIALEIVTVVYHLQTIFYRAQTRSQLCLRIYNGKENRRNPIDYLCWSSVSLFSVFNYICLGSHRKSRAGTRRCVV